MPWGARVGAAVLVARGWAPAFPWEEGRRGLCLQGLTWVSAFV